MNFKILEAIEQDNEAILKHDEEDKIRRESSEFYKTKIDPENVMTSFCIFFKLERGMTFIAICTNIAVAAFACVLALP